MLGYNILQDATPAHEFERVPELDVFDLLAGFYSLWAQSELLPGVSKAVAELLALHPAASLYSVGHSMGAAVAQLCALDMKFMYNISHVGCYTYGAPRVGNQAYQELFNSQIQESWRFTHGRDIVPSVPLQVGISVPAWRFVWFHGLGTYICMLTSISCAFVC